MKKASLLLLALSAAVSGNAQKKPKTTGASEPGHPKTSDGYYILPSSLEYKFLKDVKEGKTPKPGDIMEFSIITSYQDSVLFDTHKMNGDKPVQYAMQAPAYKGDVSEGFALMTPGDSAIFRVLVDSIQKNSQMPLQPWMELNKNKKMIYTVTMVTVKSPEEAKAEQEAHAAKQIGVDDSLIRAYLKKNNITNAQKTASGLYYVIHREGTGNLPQAGETVTVNYTGKIPDGATFDSNVDPAFQHVEPFNFTLGQGGVIKGWDEGVALLKKGAKATFYIPSGLAYGERSPNPKLIPNNAVMIFDIDVVDIKTMQQMAKEQEDAAKKQEVDAVQQKITDDKLIQDYLKEKKIKATKTASGLYYKVDKKGTGDLAKAGQKVTMNYTGRLLNGESFDSNVDPSFGHVQPFTFQLGKGMVIKGWDEGVALLNKGTKATFYIPSGMAYGPNSPSPKIPANSVLVFDVEVANIENGD